MFSFTRFCLRVLADLNEIIRRMKQNVILTIAIIAPIMGHSQKKVPAKESMSTLQSPHMKMKTMPVPDIFSTDTSIQGICIYSVP